MNVSNRLVHFNHLLHQVTCHIRAYNSKISSTGTNVYYALLQSVDDWSLSSCVSSKVKVKVKVKQTCKAP